MTKRIIAMCAVALAAALAAPALAAAHVTVNPRQVPAGAYTVLDVRVPNERDDASTVEVAVQMPPGVIGVSYEPVPGWRTKVVKEKLAEPLETPDGPITEAVSTVTWTGSGRGEGRIGPGQFRDFPISMQIPGEPGDELTFKALQTYSSGEIVRWIGGPDSDEPAATVQVVAATDADRAGSHGSAATGDSDGSEVSGTPADAVSEPVLASADDSDGGSGDGLAIAALVVGALGLAAGAAALISTRRRA